LKGKGGEDPQKKDAFHRYKYRHFCR